MRLVVVRHGKARSDSPSGRDFDRDLKPRGERQAAYLAERIARVEPAVGEVFTSAAVRARRTAGVLADRLGLRAVTDDRLLVDLPVSGLLDLIAERRGPESLVVVGHNPQLEQLVAVLTGAPRFRAAPIRTGEAVVLEIDPADPFESGTEIERIRLQEDDR